MVTILLVSALMIIVCVVVHGFALQAVAHRLFQEQDFSFYRISLLIGCAILAHLLEIVLFQLCYMLLIPLEAYGAIQGVTELNWSDLFYFSAATYTTTGYGDLTPTGNLRVFSTVEALTGLIMIAWTSSFAFLVMQSYWQELEKSQSAQ